MRPPRSTHYRFREIGQGITAGEARREGTALSNTAIVDLGDSTLVFDTSVTLRSAREARDAARAITHRPSTLCVNSHWHLDHILGNQLFSENPIYASRRTLELILEKRAELEGELRREKILSDLTEFERQEREARTGPGKAPYRAVIRVNRALLSELPDLKLTPPSATFDEEFELPGDRDARLLTFGAGHTDSDTILFDRQTRVVLAGDLIVTHNHPNFASGDPQHWLEVLDKIDRLHPDQIVPGHGPVGSAEAVGEMREYIRTVLELARAGGDPPIPARYQGWAEPDQFYANLVYCREKYKVASDLTDVPRRRRSSAILERLRGRPPRPG